MTASKSAKFVAKNGLKSSTIHSNLENSYNVQCNVFPLDSNNFNICFIILIE